MSESINLPTPTVSAPEGFFYPNASVVPIQTSSVPAIIARPSHLPLYELIGLYFLLGIVCFVQLFRIVYYGHNKGSLHVTFLILCWAATILRLVFFIALGSTIALERPTFFRVIEGLPGIIQFATYALLFIYFLQVTQRTKFQKYWRKMRNGLMVVIGVALVADILCTTLADEGPTLNEHAVRIRIFITESLFSLLSLGFLYNMYQVLRPGVDSIVLDTRQTRVWKVIALLSMLVVVLLSRAISNILAASSSFSQRFEWSIMETSPDDDNFLFFRIEIFCWELLPTFVVVCFFYVKKPRQPKQDPFWEHYGKQGLLPTVANEKMSRSAEEAILVGLPEPTLYGAVDRRYLETRNNSI
eukprot:Colp12_sorted_trinity150504_noHs@21290